MRKSSTSRASSSNPVRVSTFERDDKSGGRSDARRTQVTKSKGQPSTQADGSQIPRPRIRSTSSDCNSIRRSNLKTSAKTPSHQPQPSSVRISTATTPSHASITPRISTNRLHAEFPSGPRHRSPSAERASNFGAKGPRKDTRPLSDKAYQTQMLSKIDSFFYNIQQSTMLNANGSLKPITLKIFVEATCFLLTFLDMKHNLTISNYIEEIPKIAKKIHYPAIIAKSWLQSANTMHAWPHVLGWLSWLVDLCEAKDLAAATFTVEKLPLIGNEEDIETRRYRFVVLLKAYEAWNVNNLDKESQIIEEHVQHCNAQYGDIDAAIEETKQDIQNEEIKIQSMDQQSLELDEEINSLRELLETFKNEELQETERSKSMEESIQRSTLEIEQMNVKSNVLEEEIEKDRLRQAELVKLVENQPMSIKERDGIVQKCSEIQNDIHQFDNHVKDIEKELYAMDIKFASCNQKLYKAILAYNKDIIMHLGCDTGADLEDLKMPETNMLSPDFLDHLRSSETAMLTLKENTKKQIGQLSSLIESSDNELESLKDQLKLLREENKDHAAKMQGQRHHILTMQRRAKESEAKLKEQIKSLQNNMMRLEQSMPDLDAASNELAEAQDKYEAVLRKKEYTEKKAERFFEQFYKTMAEHRKELNDLISKLPKNKKSAFLRKE